MHKHTNAKLREVRVDLLRLRGGDMKRAVDGGAAEEHALCGQRGRGDGLGVHLLRRQGWGVAAGEDNGGARGGQRLAPHAGPGLTGDGLRA